MGVKTKRATLINKNDKTSYMNNEDFKEFLKEFLKSSKKQIASPPTEFERALIISKPIEQIRNKPTPKAILPELLEKKRPVLTVKKIEKKKKKKTTK